ncbi:MAG: SlyX family protein [Myxococcales bacterium]|nr:SlyX family protein [Myxococcales bacterium]
MQPSPEALLARLVDLELKYMTLERFAQELSAVVAEQQRTIDALTQETKRLRERALDEGSEVGPADPPPHY